MTKTVFMNQPEGFIKNSIKGKLAYKLHKALYGLKETPRAWFEKLKTTLLTKGFVPSVINTSLFIYKFEQVVYAIVYVDDVFLIGNDNALINKIISHLNKEFSLKDLRPLYFFLGFEVIRGSTSLHLSQTKYGKNLLMKANMHESKPGSTLFAIETKLFLEDNDKFEQPSFYKSLIEAL